MLRTVVFLAHADALTWRCWMYQMHAWALCTALLWKLGGIMTSHRSLLYFIFFFFTKKKLNPTNQGVPHWERHGGRAQQSGLLQRPRWGRSSADLQALDAIGAKQPWGGKKPKKHFCSLTSCPGSQVHTSAWKLRAWKTQNPRHKRFGLHRCKFRSAWQGRCQWLSAVPGRAGLCQSRSAAAQPRDSMTPGLVPRASTARGEAGMPWVKHDIGFTSQWKGFGGCLSGSLFFGGLGLFYYYILFFLSGSLSFISPQTVVSGKLLLIFKRQQEEWQSKKPTPSFVLL